MTEQTIKEAVRQAFERNEGWTAQELVSAIATTNEQAGEVAAYVDDHNWMRQQGYALGDGALHLRGNAEVWYSSKARERSGRIYPAPAQIPGGIR